MTESNLKSNMGNSSNSIDLNMSSQSFGGFARKVYLWMIGLYGCLVFNEFIKRPVDFLALALILLGLPLISRQNLGVLTQVAKHSKPTKLVFYSLFTLSLLFLSGTLNQLPKTEGLIAFGAQYGVHIGLAVVALLVIPLNEQSIRFLNKACLLALFLLALCDVLYYIEQAQAHQILGADYSHRWFGDGYVFLTPFLLARLLSFYEEDRSQESVRAARLCILYLFLIMVMLLAGGTGARSTYGILTLELLTFFGIFLWRVILIPSKIPTANLATSQTIKLGAMAIPKKWVRAAAYCMSLSILLVTIRLLLIAAIPQLFQSTLSRGLLISDRIRVAWGPGMKMIAAKPILGHGFGQKAWDLAFPSIQTHPDIVNYGGPHNWFLSTGFFGGILAMLMQLVFATALIGGLITYLRLPPKSFKFLPTSKSFALAVLISFIAFYGFRGQVESTIYKYLSLILIGFGLLQATLFQSRAQSQTPQSKTPKPQNPKTPKPQNPKTQ